MASTAKGTPAASGDSEPKGYVVREGHLPVTEFLADRAGAPSPFGDDQTFPLPPSALVYRHPTAES
jgi:succinate dehydrogenase / fumarate reductase iron-sulfur subunit